MTEELHINSNHLEEEEEEAPEEVASEGSDTVTEDVAE